MTPEQRSTIALILLSAARNANVHLTPSEAKRMAEALPEAANDWADKAPGEHHARPVAEDAA